MTKRLIDVDPSAVLADYHTGELERRVALGQVIVPMSVELVDGHLVFAEYRLKAASAVQILARGRDATYDDLRLGRKRAQNGIRWRQPGRGILREFVNLADAHDKQVLQYARRWGGLLVCNHGLPSSHNPWPIPYPNPVPRPIPWCRPLGWGGHSWWEPLAVWRDLAGRARAMLEIAIAIRSGEPCDATAWDRVLSGPEAFAGSPGDSPEADAWLLALQLSQWLQMGQVIPVVRSQKGRIFVQFAAGNLFRVLAHQLTLAIAGGPSLAFCSNPECTTKLFIPKRLPVAGRRSYCEGCRRKGIPVRDAQRDRQARLRGGGHTPRG